MSDQLAEQLAQLRSDLAQLRSSGGDKGAIDRLRIDELRLKRRMQSGSGDKAQAAECGDAVGADAPVLMIEGPQWSASSDPFVISGRQVRITQAPRGQATGSTLWDSSFVIASYLASDKSGGTRAKLDRALSAGGSSDTSQLQCDGAAAAGSEGGVSELLADNHGSHWEGVRVLEVGSGTGLLSISLGLLGSHVVATDLVDEVDLLQRNIDDNTGPEHHVRSTALDWFKPFPHAELEPLLPPRRAQLHQGDESHQRPFDLVVAADVVWVRPLVEPLVKTLAGSGVPLILMGHQRRSAMVEAYFIDLMAQEGFVLTKIPFDDMQPSYRSEKIDIWEFTRERKQ